MKGFLCISLMAVIAALASGSPTVHSDANADTELHSEPVNIEPETLQLLPLGGELNRYRKSYGSGGDYAPSPPCPKNYLFSCAPYLSPVPCASGGYSSGGGYAGAYTAPVPSYAAPPMGYSFTGSLPQFYKN